MDEIPLPISATLIEGSDLGEYVSFATKQNVILIFLLTETRKRLKDAEITIAKIGFCSPAPDEAREIYEAKYGSLRDVEDNVVR